VQAHDLAIEEGRGCSKSLLRYQQLRELRGDVSLAPRANGDSSFVQRNHRANAIPLHLVDVVGRIERLNAALRQHRLNRVVHPVYLRITDSFAQPFLLASVNHWVLGRKLRTLKVEKETVLLSFLPPNLPARKDPHAPPAVLPFRNRPVEVEVHQRVILGLNRHSFYARSR